MYSVEAIGIAAPQVGRLVRVVVVDVGYVTIKAHRLRVFVNPVILAKEGATSSDEGCLSLPGVSAEVPRAARVRVRAQNLQGEPFEVEAEGLYAICLQHELDHLIGKLYADNLSRLKRKLLLTEYTSQYSARR